MSNGKCEHDINQRTYAVTCDGYCPLCMAENFKQKTFLLESAISVLKKIARDELELAKTNSSYVEYLFGVIWIDSFDRDSEILAECKTFGDALQQMKELHQKFPNRGLAISGWNSGEICYLVEAKNLFWSSPQGTYECPICSLCSPHTHTNLEIANYRNSERLMYDYYENRRLEIHKKVAEIEEMYGEASLYMPAKKWLEKYGEKI